MREWQVGDPVGDGNDIGVPDTKYMGYLKNSTDYNPSSSINNSKQYQRRAWNAYEDNRSKDALKYINKAIDINPHDEENWNIKGIILTDLYRKNGFYEPNDVKRCYNKALEINPNNNIIKLNKAIFLTFRARERYEEEMYGIAKQEINEALDLIEDKSSDDYAIALNIKGNILLKEWDFDESLKCYNQALEIMPEYSVIKDNIKSLKKNKHLYDRGVLQYFDQGWSDNIELSKDDKPNKSQVYIDPPTIIPLDEEDNLSNILSKTKSLDEMEDEYWNLVEEKNSYDVLDEINIIKVDKDENGNNLTSTDNEVIIIDFDEENENELSNADEKELMNNFDGEKNNINYLSKIKEAKDLLDNSAITREEYDELKRKYLSLI